MKKEGFQVEQALERITSRLFQMRDLWEESAKFYFEPEKFRLALQSCISTSRTVTFIIQSNKSSFSEFGDWYKLFQERWKSDVIMVWARDARNRIEKQGDLETHSQVRAELITSYFDGPQTEWMPQALFSSPIQIWRSVPKKFLIPHVIENGTLLIERRWVANDLVDYEILEALAHVYQELSSAIISLFEKEGIQPPSSLSKSKPGPMGSLAMDRAIYLSMADGSSRGFRLFRQPNEEPSINQKKMLRSRYGPKASWKRLQSANSLQEVAGAYFDNARTVMKRDGVHYSFTFLLKNKQVVQLVRTDHPDRASRYVLMRDLARLARIVSADAVMVLSEAWTAHGDNMPPSGFASEAKVRGEILILQAADSSGDHFTLTATIQRRKIRKKKVKSVGSVEKESGFQFMFLPFFKEWNCLDEKEFQEAMDKMDELGIEAPMIANE